MTRFSSIIAMAALALSAAAQTINDTYADDAFMQGRRYYMLRSGQMKMMVQADKNGTSPAFNYLLFDAHNAANSSTKSNACNYTKDEKYFSSALRLRMKKYAFAALGNTCETRWTHCDGIPSAEAEWWASGFLVKEVITAIGDDGAFRRRIRIKSVDLVARDTAYLQLWLPEKADKEGNDYLACRYKDANIGIRVHTAYPVKKTDGRMIEIGPIVLSPNDSAEVISYLMADFQADDAQFIAGIEKLPSADAELTRQTAEKWALTNQLTSPDAVVSGLYSAVTASLPGCAGSNGAIDAGMLEYGGQWVRDASMTAIGIVHTGNFELSRAVFEHILTTMVHDEGVTMISGGFDNPDREQFDQMGELMYALKSYVDWTGDISLLKQHRDKILKLVERPLSPTFRDETGMVHNRREFWERTFDDAYELVYQTWVVVGLRCAADLSAHLNAKDRAQRWRKEADVILDAMLNHPTAQLKDNGHLIKRRNRADKQIASTVIYGGWKPGAPGTVESMSSIYPDATMALPVALNVIDPASELARQTILETEKLWNRRWSFGGHDRYHTSSQADQPGPWPFATCFILRGEHEAGMYDYSRRSLEWLYQIDGGKAGLWYEEIPLIPSIYASAGLLPWTSGEVGFFIIHHLLGVKFDGDRMTIKPNLYATTAPVKADLRYRDSRIKLEITGGNGTVSHAIVNGNKILPDKQGRIVVPPDFTGGTISIKVSIN